MEIVSFDPLTAGHSDWARFHTYRHARHAESDPDEPVISDAEVEEEERQPHPHVNRLRWLALDEGRLVGSSVAFLPTQESPGYAERARFLNAFGNVLVAVRRRGVGTRLISQVHAVRCGHAQTTLDISHYREWYRQLDRIGGAHHLMLLRESDGQLVGVSEATWDPRIPQRAWQLFTGVRRQWRRGGLAKCLKAALLRQVRASHPSVTEMITSNASENTAMLAVNARIGFAVFRMHGIYQIERHVLGAWISARISR
jgi:RimJ/RimL family protein N-acetyltransferase